MGVGRAQAPVVVADSVIGRAVEHAREGQRDVVRGIGELLVAADALLGEKVGEGAREARRSVFVVDVHEQMVLGGKAHKVMKPSGPTVRSILHEATLHARDAPLAEHGEEFAGLLHQCVLVDVEPHAHALRARVAAHLGHIEPRDHLRGIAVVAGARLIPFPVEEHIADVVLSTEIDGGASALHRQRGLAHDSAGHDPLGGVGNLARRVEHVHQLVALEQLSRRIGGEDHFPRRGVVRDDVHGTVHHRLQGVGSPAFCLQARQAPIVGVGREQCGPDAAGVVERQGHLHGARQLAYGLMLEESLRPLLAPGVSARGQ